MSEISQSLPPSFCSRMKNYLGAEYKAFMQSMTDAPPVSVRLNPNKPGKQWAASEPVPWCFTGSYLPERPSFTFDPLFHAGAYYVQEASSMFLEEVWNRLAIEQRALRVLDMCAAPGGKSTHLLTLLPQDSLLVSNEVIPKRNSVLRENLAKWGAANSLVTQNNPEDFSRLPNYFDVVLVDAPCSGEGLFRKDQNAAAEWSEANVARCSLRQRHILKYAIRCLKPGGYLLYSTCTYEEEENDDSVAYAVAEGMERITLPISFSGIKATAYGLQLMPHRIRGEGFFIAALRKPLAEIPAAVAARKNATSPPPLADFARRYLSKPELFALSERQKNLYAIPHIHLRDFQTLSATLYVRQAGILIGTLKGNDLIPAQQLALSTHLRHDLPTVVLGEEEALAYLRCEPIRPPAKQQGWMLAAYKNFNLGWMKVMAQRSNNYYPKEWRILKRAAPSENQNTP